MLSLFCFRYILQSNRPYVPQWLLLLLLLFYSRVKKKPVQKLLWLSQQFKGIIEKQVYSLKFDAKIPLNVSVKMSRTSGNNFIGIVVYWVKAPSDIHSLISNADIFKVGNNVFTLLCVYCFFLSPGCSPKLGLFIAVQLGSLM